MIKRLDETETEYSLYKTYVPDMPTLYYAHTSMGIFCWQRGEGWHDTRWNNIKDLEYYFRTLQGGDIQPTNELTFLLDSGQSFQEAFKEVRAR